MSVSSSTTPPTLGPLAPPIEQSLVSQTQPPAPGLTPLFRCAVTLIQPSTIGQTSVGVRKVVPLLSGELTAPSGSAFDGAKLLQGSGADYFRTDANGTTWLDARYTFALSSGHTLFVQSSGTRYAHDDEAAVALAKLGSEELDPKRYYFRLRLVLESDDPDDSVQRATKSIVVASGVRGSTSVIYDAFILT